MIMEEVEDAEHYAKCATHYKEERPQLAAVFYELANQELMHSDRLHTEVVKIINEYKAEKGEPPAEMLAVYNYLHDKDIQHTAEVKMLLSEYKGM